MGTCVEKGLFLKAVFNTAVTSKGSWMAGILRLRRSEIRLEKAPVWVGWSEEEEAELQAGV